jgi:hypothetical protein
LNLVNTEVTHIFTLKTVDDICRFVEPRFNPDIVNGPLPVHFELYEGWWNQPGLRPFQLDKQGEPRIQRLTSCKWISVQRWRCIG